MVPPNTMGNCHKAATTPAASGATITAVIAVLVMLDSVAVPITPS